MADDLKEKIYLKGYREGMEAGLKIAWAYAEQLLIDVDNNAKLDVQKYIDKLKK